VPPSKYLKFSRFNPPIPQTIYDPHSSPPLQFKYTGVLFAAASSAPFLCVISFPPPLLCLLSSITTDPPPFFSPPLFRSSPHTVEAVCDCAVGLRLEVFCRVCTHYPGVILLPHPFYWRRPHGLRPLRPNRGAPGALSRQTPPIILHAFFLAAPVPQDSWSTFRVTLAFPGLLVVGGRRCFPRFSFEGCLVMVRPSVFPYPSAEGLCPSRRFLFRRPIGGLREVVHIRICNFLAPSLGLAFFSF